MSAQSQNGMALNVGDYVRFPNPQAGQPSYAYGVISAVLSGANTVNIAYPYLSAGVATLGSAVAVAGNTVLQMGSASGPGNSESNRGV